MVAPGARGSRSSSTTAPTPDARASRPASEAIPSERSIMAVATVASAMPDVASRRAPELEVDTVDQDVRRDDGAVVQDRGVIADPERHAAGRPADGLRDGRHLRLLW